MGSDLSETSRAISGAEPRVQLNVLTYLDRALARASRSDDVSAELSRALVALTPRLSWTQTESYTLNPPNTSFLGGYAHATIVGPRDRDGGALDRREDEAAVGVVLLGPHVVYPAHRHPADEIYVPLGDIRWVHSRIDDDATERAGAVIHHQPWQPHGMIVDDAPVLLIYLWTGDVRSPSTFCF